MTTVLVTLAVEGFHRWPQAAEVLPEMSFLAQRHRHVFHITAEKEVFHDERDVEFIAFKRQINRYINAKWGDPAEFGDMSCEAIARHLSSEFGLISCEVSEDKENGSKYYSNK